MPKAYQMVHRDAASQMTGTVAFCSSENGIGRWSVTMAQRAMVVTKLKTVVGLDHGESTAAQCRQSRIRKDNNQMEALSEKIGDFCNPFADNVSHVFVNLASGQAASNTTETHLLNKLKRGKEASETVSGRIQQLLP